MTREEAIERALPNIIAFYQPERIYLYGSTARGDYKEHSDIDMMVLLPDDAAEKLFRSSHLVDQSHVPYSIQIVTWTVTNFDRRLHLKASFPSTIVREGRLLYDRADVTV